MNSGDTEKIVSLLTTGSGKTTTVSLSAARIGLPSGGYVILSITGDGVSYTADSYKSDDGNVVSINGYPGQNAPTGGTTYYDVASDSKIDVRLQKVAYETNSIPSNGSGATFTCKVDGNTIGTAGSTQEAALPISDVLSAMGIDYNSIPDWDGTGAQPSGGVEIRITCTISFGGVTKNSSSSSSYETYNVVSIYR